MTNAQKAGWLTTIAVTCGAIAAVLSAGHWRTVLLILGAIADGLSHSPLVAPFRYW